MKVNIKNLILYIVCGVLMITDAVLYTGTLAESAMFLLCSIAFFRFTKENAKSIRDTGHGLFPIFEEK